MITTRIRNVTSVGQRVLTRRIGQQGSTSAAYLSTTSNVATTNKLTNDNNNVLLIGLAASVLAVTSITSYNNNISTTSCSANKIPSSGDIISSGTPTKEPSTGILFPQLCNGYYLVGCGVRVKYGFVKVYAVGTYVDPLAMSAIKKSNKVEVIEEALCNPTYPRTIRIVMNRSLSIDKYTSAIVESLKPRMKGQDLDKLEEFKALNPKVDLVEGMLIYIYYLFV